MTLAVSATTFAMPSDVRRASVGVVVVGMADRAGFESK